jgi:hypothetical protein
MSVVNSLISKRLNKSEPSKKMVALAEKSASGELTSFGGIFHPTKLSEDEKSHIEQLLHHYASGNREIRSDLDQLILITSEVKAINHQAALLHGERIKRAQDILKNYREGAFTTWMIGVYGNRQTPYNLLHYYLFYQSLPKEVRPPIEAMPRQAVYSIASRSGELQEKIDFLMSNQGKRKHELLTLMRDLFPLDRADRRRERPVEGALQALERAKQWIDRKRGRLSALEKEALQESVAELQSLIKEKS